MKGHLPVDNAVLGNLKGHLPVDNSVLGNLKGHLPVDNSVLGNLKGHLPVDSAVLGNLIGHLKCQYTVDDIHLNNYATQQMFVRAERSLTKYISLAKKSFLKRQCFLSY